nr:MAG TPA: hypothetical protein [Caudoviricetes sp.]
MYLEINNFSRGNSSSSCQACSCNSRTLSRHSTHS